MANFENQSRHRDNKSILHGRQGSKGWFEKGQLRGGGGKYSVESTPMVTYSVRLLSPDEVLYNLRLLDEKPNCPEDIIQSIEARNAAGVILYEHRNGQDIPLKHSIVPLDQVETVEQMWLESASNGTLDHDIFLTDDMEQ